MKGVVLAGGLGSRLYPLTKITNKHLLPIYDQPMIYYPLQRLVEAGIREIMLVTGGSFAGHFLNLLENGGDFGLKRLHYAFQRGEGGIADALKLAEDFVDGDRCVVILGDNIFENPIVESVEKFRKQQDGARILLKEVPDPERFGVAELRDGKVVSIEEKPAHPKSNYAVTGVYMYDAYVWEVVKTLKPSRRNELEITDVNNAYIARGNLYYDIVEGWWTDAGTFDSLLRANLLVAKQRSGNKEFSLI
jgi:glucose-1-phosphate thymidylyltransferase